MEKQLDAIKEKLLLLFDEVRWENDSSDYIYFYIDHKGLKLKIEFLNRMYESQLENTAHFVRGIATDFLHHSLNTILI
jgi:hypothetical protein